MKPAPFSYFAPRSLAEAIASLAEHGEAASLLAGGQSLGPLLNLRLASPSILVDLNRISELSSLRVDDRGWLRIGAMARQSLLEHSQVVARGWPLWFEAVRHVGHVSIRNRGTVGGSLCHADPNAELPAVALLSRAQLVLSGPSGDRIVNASDFFMTYFTTAAGPDEVLTEIRVPPQSSHSGTAWVEFAVRHGDFPVVGVAASVEIADSGEFVAAHVALAGVAGRPVMVGRDILAGLSGHHPTQSSLVSEVATAISDDLEPEPDLIAGAAYKRKLVRVLVGSAIDAAASRAQPA